MVVIEVFTPVVQRILKHNMVSSLPSLTAKLEEKGTRPPQPFTFPEIWGGVGWRDSQGLSLGFCLCWGFCAACLPLVLYFSSKTAVAVGTLPWKGAQLSASLGVVPVTSFQSVQGGKGGKSKYSGETCQSRPAPDDQGQYQQLCMSWR